MGGRKEQGVLPIDELLPVIGGVNPIIAFAVCETIYIYSPYVSDASTI